jgi:RsiW-degrading membrane proteinase PrsW (M82 family)
MEYQVSTVPLFPSLVAGVLPTIVYVFLIWRIDRYEKEPLRLLLVAFLWGAAPAVLLSIVLELAFDQPLALLSDLYRPLEYYGDFISMGIITPPIEEITKGVALLGLFVLARREFDGTLDGIIYGSLVGFGFAMTENVLYFVRAWQQDGLQGWGMVVFIRALVFGLNHAMYTSFTGVGFGLARYSRSRRQGTLYILAGLLAAILTHAIHNTFLSLEDMCMVSLVADWLGIGVVVVIILLTWRRERLWMTTQLAHEVRWGVLTEEQLQIILSRRRRWSKEWEALEATGMREARLWHKLADTAGELAFKTHQEQALGPEQATTRLIPQLRARIIQIRRELGDSAAADSVVCAQCGRPSPAADVPCPHCSVGRAEAIAGSE